MFKLDNEFLTNLGLGGLPVEEKNRLLQMIYERLEMNVGMRLAEKMSDQQLDEFESFIDRNDEAGALKWLETNFPNYKDVVAEELEKLKREVQQAAPQILSAAQAQAGQVAQQPLPQQMPPAPDNAAYSAPQQPPAYNPPQPPQPPAPSYAAPAPDQWQQPVPPTPAPQMPPQQPMPAQDQSWQQPPQQQPQAPTQPDPGFGPPPQYQQPQPNPQQYTPPPPGYTPGQ